MHTISKFVHVEQVDLRLRNRRNPRAFLETPPGNPYEVPCRKFPKKYRKTCWWNLARNSETQFGEILPNSGLANPDENWDIPKKLLEEVSGGKFSETPGGTPIIFERNPRRSYRRNSGSYRKYSEKFLGRNLWKNLKLLVRRPEKPLREISGKFSKHFLKESREKPWEHTGRSPERNIGEIATETTWTPAEILECTSDKTLEGALGAWSFPAISFREKYKRNFQSSAGNIREIPGDMEKKLARKTKKNRKFFLKKILGRTSAEVSQNFSPETLGNLFQKTRYRYLKLLKALWENFVRISGKNRPRNNKTRKKNQSSESYSGIYFCRYPVEISCWNSRMNSVRNRRFISQKFQFREKPRKIPEG